MIKLGMSAWLGSSPWPFWRKQEMVAWLVYVPSTWLPMFADTQVHPSFRPEPERQKSLDEASKDKDWQVRVAWIGLLEIVVQDFMSPSLLNLFLGSAACMFQTNSWICLRHCWLYSWVQQPVCFRQVRTFRNDSESWTLKMKMSVLLVQGINGSSACLYI